MENDNLKGEFERLKDEKARVCKILGPYIDELCANWSECTGEHETAMPLDYEEIIESMYKELVSTRKDIRGYAGHMFYGYHEKGLWWFRFFGYGLNYTNFKYQWESFSARNRLEGIRIGNYRIKILTPGNL